MTCSSIKNARLCSAPDKKPGAGTGSAGVGPDAVHVHLSFQLSAFASFFLKHKINWGGIFLQ